MDDIEEQKGLVSEPEKSMEGIGRLTCCGATIRFGDRPLLLVDLIKVSTCIIFLQFVVMAGLSMAQTTTATYTYLCLFQIGSKSVFYMIVYANLLSGGWGAQDTRFWCDIKIMFVRGFNTIRSISNMISSVINFWIVAVVLNLDGRLAMALILPLAVLSEWQGGIAENLSQESVKASDKFLTSGGQLNLETLHFHQSQLQNETPKKSQAFLISAFIKTYVMTCLLAIAHWDLVSPVFGVPIVMTIVGGIYIIPLFLEMAYIKKMRTFCQVEIYRIVLDCIIPMVIAAFSLV